MAFWAKSFVFDGVPSEAYDLFLISDGASGVLDNTGSCSVELYTQQVYRNPKPYLFGTQQSPTLTFNLTFASLKPISALNQQAIQRWLFGYNSYKKLQILQCDMDNVYFNCILTEPTLTTVGNFAYSFKCSVVCDAPWAWEFPKTYTFKSTPNKIINWSALKFINTSDNNYYTYPLITLQTTINGGVVNFTNVTDNNIGFSISGMLSNEIITIDCEKCIIKSNMRQNMLNYFTGTFVRLVPNLNTLSISGEIDNVKITVNNARKVSG